MEEGAGDIRPRRRRKPVAECRLRVSIGGAGAGRQRREDADGRDHGIDGVRHTVSVIQRAPLGN